MPPREHPSFELEPTTVWSFPTRGSWATHRGDYPGNWAPQVPRNLILRYSHTNETVLDPFVGSGTTLIECQLLSRNGVGIDINPNAVELSRDRLSPSGKGTAEQTVLIGDARHLAVLADSIDLICAHPPYANAIPYSRDMGGDLSRIADVDRFIHEMARVASEAWRVLKPRRMCSVLMGDIRRVGHVIPLGFLTMNAFLSVGFLLREIIIKVQHNCSSTNYWSERANRVGFLLLMHEYVFVFEKPSSSKPWLRQMAAVPT